VISNLTKPQRQLVLFWEDNKHGPKILMNAIRAVLSRKAKTDAVVNKIQYATALSITDVKLHSKSKKAANHLYHSNTHEVSRNPQSLPSWNGLAL